MCVYVRLYAYLRMCTTTKAIHKLKGKISQLIHENRPTYRYEAKKRVKKQHSKSKVCVCIHKSTVKFRASKEEKTHRGKIIIIIVIKKTKRKKVTTENKNQQSSIQINSIVILRFSTHFSFGFGFSFRRDSKLHQYFQNIESNICWTWQTIKFESCKAQCDDLFCFRFSFVVGGRKVF